MKTRDKLRTILDDLPSDASRYSDEVKAVRERLHDLEAKAIATNDVEAARVIFAADLALAEGAVALAKERLSFCR